MLYTAWQHITAPIYGSVTLFIHIRKLNLYFKLCSVLRFPLFKDYKVTDTSIVNDIRHEAFLLPRQLCTVPVISCSSLSVSTSHRNLSLFLTAFSLPIHCMCRTKYLFSYSDYLPSEPWPKFLWQHFIVAILPSLEHINPIKNALQQKLLRGVP